MLNRLSLFVAVAALAAGCDQPEIDRPGTWKSTGVNDQNLRAMLVNPQDAYAGTSTLTASRGDSGARAVTRLLTERRRPLLNATISRTGGGGADSQSDSPAAAPAPTGGASLGGAP